MLRSYELGGRELKICNFCRKQLDSVERDPVNNRQQAMNLLEMDTQGKRSADTQRRLTEHFGKLGISDNTESKAAESDLQKQVTELNEKVNTLESELHAFRRRYIISKILGITLPVAFVVLMLIILVASGALKNLFGYYNTIMDYANM